ncbi:MAG TPA: chromosomal replication initiator protein DnaA [Verrucomicrobiaceae bacterium]
MTACADAQLEEPPLCLQPAEPSAREIQWGSVCANARERIGSSMYEKWFSKAVLIDLSDTRLVFSVPNLIHQYWIEDNYKKQLHAAVEQATGCSCTIDIMTRVEDPSQPELPGAAIETPLARVPKAAGGKPARTLLDSGLNGRFTFDSFVVGSNCSYSCAAARAVADKPGKTYNPLFLHGHAGLGKTHLMQAIGQEVLRQKPRKSVRYVTSESFTNEYIDALRNGRISGFRQRYRDVDVLLVDDVHFLGGKQSTQEEFFHTFNDLHNHHKQIVLASDRPPSEIANLEQRLVSRFEWGLATRIQSPDLETRSAILRQKMSDWTVPVEEWILQYIAEHIHTNVRRLEGALMRVAAHKSLGGTELTPEFLDTMLRDILEEAESRNISIDYIQKVVAEHFDVRLADMTSRRRPKSIAEPRQLAMYLARELTKNSLMDIGDAFGGRDHGTVIHACKVVAGRMAAAEDFRRTVSALVEKVSRL